MNKLRHVSSLLITGKQPQPNYLVYDFVFCQLYLKAGLKPETFINGLLIGFTGFFSSSPKAFIGDPVFFKKSLDSRSEALRE
jgi:hypothetical protein